MLLFEVNKFLKKAMDPDSLQNNLKIVDVTAESMISETELDANDCLALKIMRDLGISEIYSFDRGFERFVRRLP